METTSIENTIAAPQSSPEETRRRIPALGSRLLRWALIIVIPLAVLALFLLVVGVDPIETYAAMFTSSVGDFYSISEVLLRASPFILAALATVIPAQVRLVNVGAEGQLAIGALVTTFVAVA